MNLSGTGALSGRRVLLRCADPASEDGILEIYAAFHN